MEINKPSFALTLAEPFRALREFMELFVSAPSLMQAPRGDGHTVLVLPGFASTDMSMLLLRRYLEFLGYRTAVWGLGANLGYQMLGKAESKLRAKVKEIAEQSGDKISVVGWSLGGVMARHMAREHPEHIRRVVTLGAPFNGNPTATAVRGLYEWVSGENLDSPKAQSAWRANRAPPPVPSAAIYSKTDGILAWQNCVECESELATNVEVTSSHLGLPHNPAVLLALAEQLALPYADAVPAKALS